VNPPAFDIQHPELVLGIDGGGTQTQALLARRDNGEVLGRGIAGPSNIQAVGVETGLKAISDSIRSAFRDGNLPHGSVSAICMGLAGIDWDGGLNVILDWAEKNAVAGNVQVANDATLLLAAGTPEGWGLAVIAGTGAIAFVKDASGREGRCGGWGYLLGDEGSAYSIAISALKAACRSFDGVEKPTALVECVVEKMKIGSIPAIIEVVYRGAWDRTAIAGLAPAVLEIAAGGDSVAIAIVRKEAEELARTAVGAVNASALPKRGLPVALAGGVLTRSEMFRGLFLDALRIAGIETGPVNLVTDPALGAVKLAMESGGTVSPR
jgi:N-acetylglucosamine kinase-like BadF-type ATPase